MIKDLNLTLERGKITAIVGVSGAGKSTLAQLLLRLYDPTQGEIIVDQHTNLRDLELCSYHDQIAYVSQKPNLFGSTVRDCVAYGSRYKESCK